MQELDQVIDQATRDVKEWRAYVETTTPQLDELAERLESALEADAVATSQGE